MNPDPVRLSEYRLNSPNNEKQQMELTAKNRQHNRGIGVEQKGLIEGKNQRAGCTN